MGLPGCRIRVTVGYEMTGLFYRGMRNKKIIWWEQHLLISTDWILMAVKLMAECTCHMLQIVAQKVAGCGIKIPNVWLYVVYAAGCLQHSVVDKNLAVCKQFLEACGTDFLRIKWCNFLFKMEFRMERECRYWRKCGDKLCFVPWKIPTILIPLGILLTY